MLVCVCRFQDVDNIYTQHKPVLHQVLVRIGNVVARVPHMCPQTKLKEGKLKTSSYPFIEGETNARWHSFTFSLLFAALTI